MPATDKKATSKAENKLAADELFLRKNGWIPAKYDAGYWRKDSYGTRTMGQAVRIQHKIASDLKDREMVDELAKSIIKEATEKLEAQGVKVKNVEVGPEGLKIEVDDEPEKDEKEE
jgi:hypothetical protein